MDLLSKILYDGKKNLAGTQIQDPLNTEERKISYVSAAYVAAYVACLPLLCQGPSGLTVRASDYYSEVLGLNPSWILDFFLIDLFLTLSAKT